MPLPNGNFAKLVMSGPVSAQDSWSCGVWWTFVDPISQSELDAFTTVIGGQFSSDFWAASVNPWTARCAADTKLSQAKSFYYENNVLKLESVRALGPTAGTSATRLPAYTAKVFTLLTTGFGRSARGRIYLPATGFPCAGANLQWASTPQECQNLATWLQRNTAAGVSTVIGSAVVSLTHASALDITAVRTDSIPDTQRGRYSRATADFTNSNNVGP